MAKSYLWAVQDQAGREVCHWRGEVERVSEVTSDVTCGEDGQPYARIWRNGTIEALGAITPELTGRLTLHRWFAKDKLAESVKHSVR